MVSYGSSTPAYSTSSGGYTVVGYGSSSSYSGVTKSGWKKSTCCQSFMHGGSRCSDCPGN